MTLNRSKKKVGDGGEHYVCAMLNFHGVSSAKMPDGWFGYDLIADAHSGAQRIQVKSASEMAQEWQRSNSMKFWDPKDTSQYDWLALVLWNAAIGTPRVWLIPSSVAELHRHTSKTREILFSRVDAELSFFENNWALSHQEM